MKHRLNPIHIHKGNNHLRIISIIILLSITITASYSLTIYGAAFFPMILASLFGLFTIRFPRILVYNNEFVIQKAGLISKFNDYHTFKIKELEKVEFSKGFTDWNFLIVIALFGHGGFGGNNKADQIIIKTKQNETRVFNRFGPKKKFIETIELINKQNASA